MVEQNCVFLDADDKDQNGYHQLIYSGKQLAAYARILPPGKCYGEVAIGRVVTAPAFRGKGLGRKVMELAIQSCREIFGDTPIRIGAQFYTLKFYYSLGFVQDGAVYDEDGIEHVQMLLQPR